MILDVELTYTTLIDRVQNSQRAFRAGEKMDIQINKELVKERRLENIWTQQQLADEAGISLRTIQRIENTGSGSLDSVKALATSLGIESSSLLRFQKQTDPQSISSRSTYRKKLMILIVLAGLLGNLGYFSLANAKPITLAIVVDSDQIEESQITVTGEPGVSQEQTFGENLKLVFTPWIIENDRIRVDVEVYKLQQDLEPRLLATPRIDTILNTSGKITFGILPSSYLELVVTPKYLTN